MNTHYWWALGGRGGETRDVKVRKRGAPSDTEDWEHLNKKLRQASNVREWLKATEDWKRRAQFDDKKCDEDASPVKRLCLILSAECGGSECGRSECSGSECGRSDGASFVCQVY